ncbi:uncharacterized protein LOC128736620 [Sabethes cyaneus]|uniref:uncharacterized protein LOC128736620 n=1 Tax=Sabethes cyaneus TaxID=53552 RepID=UPI00237E6025|nr:uncharacterized protein LOC128736620 [Sabethes cyaneus]
MDARLNIFVLLLFMSHTRANTETPSEHLIPPAPQQIVPAQDVVQLSSNQQQTQLPSDQLPAVSSPVLAPAQYPPSQYGQPVNHLNGGYQFPQQYPSQYPPQFPPQLPPQLQPQYPIQSSFQLPAYIHQHIALELQPQTAAKTSLSYSPHFPTNFTPPFPPKSEYPYNGFPPANSLQFPPKPLSSYNSYFPPNLTAQTPPKVLPAYNSFIPPLPVTNSLYPAPSFQLPLQIPAPFPPKITINQLPLSSPSNPKLSPTSTLQQIPIQNTNQYNNSQETTRVPKTLQAIGSSNPLVFHKITDNLRPGGATWYYKQNQPQNRSPHPLAPKLNFPAQPPQNSQLNLANHVSSHNQLPQSSHLEQLNPPPPPLPPPPPHPPQQSHPNQLNNHFPVQSHLQSNHLQQPTHNHHQYAHSPSHGQHNLNAHHVKPLTPFEVFNYPEFQITPITIPSPEYPHFETLRNQVSFLKAKHKHFFESQPGPLQSAPLKQSLPHALTEHSQWNANEHQKTVPSNHNNIPPHKPPAHSQRSPTEQNKLVPPKWNPVKQEFEQANTPPVDYGQFNSQKNLFTANNPHEQFHLPPAPDFSQFSPQKNLLTVHNPHEQFHSPAFDFNQFNAQKNLLSIHSDYAAFPPAAKESAVLSDLAFISNWEKALGIIHKTDHGNAEKGQTILSAGDTDDFKKMDTIRGGTQQNLLKSHSKSATMQRRSEVIEERIRKKPFSARKKSNKKEQSTTKKQKQQLSDEKPTTELVVTTTEVMQIVNVTETVKPADDIVTESSRRRKRDVEQVEAVTIVSEGQANTTAVPISQNDTSTEAHPLLESSTTEQTTEPIQVATLPQDAELLPQAEALAAKDSAEEEYSEYEDVPHAEALVYDDFDDAYYDDDEESSQLPAQARSDSFFFEERDGTTSRPYAEALVDPRNLHGKALIRFLEEAIRNSSVYLPVEADDRSFDIVEPPKDVIKFPYYERTEQPINVDSALRFAENLTLFSNGPYNSKSGNQCNEVDIEISEEPEEPEGEDGFQPVRRLRRLGNGIDCLKNKHFGKEPLDNPLFKEQFVGVGRSASGGSSVLQPQPDPSVAVFSDVIRLIKQLSTEENREKARSTEGIVSPRQLNLPEPKSHSPNNAVLEQLRLGKRKTLPLKPTKKAEEPKQERNETTNSEQQHPLRIVFPRRLNFSKTFDEGKKPALVKVNYAKHLESDGIKVKLNRTRLTDHDSYKANLARKLNFDKLDKQKIPISQRRESRVDTSFYEPYPTRPTRFMNPGIFDISTYYPRFTARGHDLTDEVDDDDDDDVLVEKRTPAKQLNYDLLEREADEMLSSVRTGRKEKAVGSKPVALPLTSGQNSGQNSVKNTGQTSGQKKEEAKPYGTSYAPSYKQIRLLSSRLKQKDDGQKKPPSLDELINFYTNEKSHELYSAESSTQRRDGSSSESSYVVPTVHNPLPIFDVSTYYPRYMARANEELKRSHHEYLKRRDTQLVLDDLAALRAPKEYPNGDRKSDYNSNLNSPTSAPIRDDIADFFEDSLSSSSTPNSLTKDSHHTFKKSEPYNPDLPVTDKATFGLDQPPTKRKPVKKVPRKRFKAGSKSLKRRPVKYRKVPKQLVPYIP